MTLWQQINFTNKADTETWVDPTSLHDDDKKQSVETLGSGMKNFIRVLKKPNGYYGVPDKTKDPEGFDTVVRGIRLYVKHVICMLRTRTPKARSKPLIDLAGTGLHCGGKTISFTEDLYNQMMGTSYDAEGDTVSGMLDKLLKDLRLGTFKS